MVTKASKQQNIKTGLFFGSFNPIHTGHLIIANYLLQHTELETIWFVVSPLNPLKEKKDLFDENTRVELVQLAIENNPRFRICLRELTMQRPSYSVNTIETLQREYPGNSFVLIIGSDNLEVFDQWKDHEKLLEMVPLMVYPRTAQCDAPFVNHPSVNLIPAPLLEISSTFIRECLLSGKDIRYLVPENVYQKIREGILR